MLNHKLLSPEGILVLEPTAPLEAADFEGLAHEIDPYITEHGKLPGLMIHAKVFPGWVNLEAAIAHLRFIESHHQKIRRLAVVSDSGLLTELPKIAAHLVRAEVKHFPESAYQAALHWLGEAATLTEAKESKMSIQLDEENGGKLLVVHVSGKLAKADYEHFVPEFERLVQQHGKLRVLFDMTGFHGWDLGALWEDIKFDIKHFADIERLALVGEKKWQHGMATFCKPFTKATIRYFDHAEAAEARKWVAEV